jgi:hypothetical protein
VSVLARKLLVAGALAVGGPAAAAPAAARSTPEAQEAPEPPVDTRRVTGNVILGVGKGEGDQCRLDEARSVALAEAEVDPQDPTRCTVAVPKETP